MTHQQQTQNEEGESLERSTKLDDGGHLSLNLLFVFRDFNHSYQSGDLDKLVKLTDPSDSDHLINLGLASIVLHLGHLRRLVGVSSSDDQLEWNDGEEIYKEPRDEVGVGNLFAVVDYFIGFIDVGTVEVNHDIDEEETIDRVVHVHVPSDGFKSFRER